MRTIYTLLIIFAGSFAFAQAPLTVGKSAPIAFENVELQPQYQGGLVEFTKFIAKNFNASELEQGGEIVVTFVIETNGNVSEIKVVKDIGGNSADEARRVVSMSPRWKPGESNGIPVRVSYRLPINIRI